MNNASRCVIAVFAVAAALPVMAEPMDAMKKAGCMNCHAPDKKMIGPSFADIAAKYQGQQATDTLVQKVREGGKGVWGPIPMPPHGAAQIDDEALVETIEYILSNH